MGGAADAIEKAKRVAFGLSPWFDAIILADEARLHLARGDIAAASRWAQTNEAMLNGELVLSYCSIYLVLARALIALDRLDDALSFLARLLTMAESAGARWHVIQVLILQAAAWQAHGKPNQALTALSRAVELAEPEGMVRAFVDGGEPVRWLLQRMMAEYGRTKEYLGKLLAAFGPEPETIQGKGLHPSPSTLQPLMEPLSERERQVLRLLAGDLTSAEIADVLFISANTVRSHVKSIYGKLNVHQRSAALERAKELGLV
jgi:LuxR family maltose regulon positive regulatory protein